MAYYLVEGPKGKALIETRTAKGAINHLAQKEYKATSLNSKELVKYIKEGLEIETIEEAAADQPKSATPKVEAPKALTPGKAA